MKFFSKLVLTFLSTLLSLAIIGVNLWLSWLIVNFLLSTTTAILATIVASFVIIYFLLTLAGLRWPIEVEIEFSRSK